MFRLGNARYHGDWKNQHNVFETFFPQHQDNNEEDMKAFPEDSCVLFASYNSFGSYDGHCLFLFVREGQLYVVEDSHCSCNGLDYNPDPVTWFQLWEMSIEEPHNIQAQEAWRALVGHNVTLHVEVLGESEDILTVSRNPSGPGKKFMLVPMEFIQGKVEEEG